MSSLCHNTTLYKKIVIFYVNIIYNDIVQQYNHNIKPQQYKKGLKDDWGLCAYPSADNHEVEKRSIEG